MPQLILIYARKLFGNESDLDEFEQFCSSAYMYIKAVEAIELQKCPDVKKSSERKVFHDDIPSAYLAISEYLLCLKH